MPLGGSGPKRVGAFLPSALARRLAVYLGESERLQTVWQQHVGPPLVHHSLPVAYLRGCLEIRVDSAAWATRLRHAQSAVLARIKEVPGFQDLRELKVRIEPSGAASARRAEEEKGSKPNETRKPSARTARLLRSLAQDVHDPALRAALERLGQTFEPGSGAEKK